MGHRFSSNVAYVKNSGAGYLGSKVDIIAGEEDDDGRGREEEDSCRLVEDGWSKNILHT